MFWLRITVKVHSFGPHLVEDVPVEVRHVALVRQGPFVVFFEMLLKVHGVVRDLHHRAQVIGQHLHIQSKTVNQNRKQERLNPDSRRIMTSLKFQLYSWGFEGKLENLKVFLLLHCTSPTAWCYHRLAWQLVFLGFKASPWPFKLLSFCGQRADFWFCLIMKPFSWKH